METYSNYFELLELHHDAKTEDILTNYRYLKCFYSSNAVELSILDGDFTQELRQNYLSRLDEAYEKLKAYLESKQSEVIPQTEKKEEEAKLWIRNMDCLNGAALKRIRERKGVDLKEIFAVTRIQPRYLEDIENEKFEAFRAEAYLRSYIVEYSRFLSLDSQKVLADYMPRYRSWAASTTNQSIGDIDDLVTKLA